MAKKKKVELSNTDFIAIRDNDRNYLLNKGAKLYVDETYYQSVEYYRLAASMGEPKAISNLGYCYLYGRDIEVNVDLAIAYFTIAANKGDIEANYKLGDIYSRDKWVKPDKELAIYYYDRAIKFIIGGTIESDRDVLYVEELDNYPSLCFAVGREMFIGGDMNTDLMVSYQLLKHAEIGYKREIDNGFGKYIESYNKVLEYLNRQEFKEAKEYYEKNEEE